MIEFNEVVIKNLSIQKTSFKNNKESVSVNLYDYKNDEEEEILKKTFIRPFISHSTTFEFKHPVELELNPLFNLSKSIYNGSDFLKISKGVGQHLQSVSNHPNIKDGELFIVKYDDIKMNNKFYEGLGVYKVENKESFIETRLESTADFFIAFKSGISGRKLDKACLILFNEEPYTILIIDNNSIETDYWKNEFINVKYKNDALNNTSHFLALTKSFVTEKLPDEYNISKAEQANMLNKSVNYFKENEIFDLNNFQETVLNDKRFIRSFQEFGSQYSDKNDIDIAGQFEISDQAVKKQAKVFKSILKLDKNFHIYIHGRTDLIEKGVEANGRKFYKIYYQDES